MTEHEQVNEQEQKEVSLIAKLNNIRTIRKEARETDFAIFEEVVEKLLVVLEEARKEHSELEKKQQERAETIEKLRKMLEEEGIEGIAIVDALTNPQAATAVSDKPKSGRGPKKGVKRGSVEPKYEFDSADGKKTWTGRGRMPLELKALIEQGANIEDFLIKK